MVWLWVLAGVVAVGLFAVWMGASSEKRRRRSGMQFARRNHALIDSEFVTAFDQANERSRRLGALLFFGVFSTLLVLGQLLPRSVPVMSLEGDLLGVAAAIWFAVRLYEAGREFPAPRGRPVIARPVRTVPSDYVAPQTRILTVLIAALVAVFGVVVARRWIDGDLRAVDAVVLLAGASMTVLIAVAVEAYARVMCERPQPAVDACHLYFQDAWRGEALNHAHLAVVICGFQLVMGAYGADLVLDWSKPYLILAVAVASLSLLSSGTTRRRFRQRLWPGLPPGEVLRPGDPAPPRVGATS